MRKIKFRIFQKFEKTMVPHEEIRSDEWTVEELLIGESDYWSEPMQFTGLTDKHGQEIYEGDILKQEYVKVISSHYDPATLGFEGEETEEGHHIGEVVILASKGVCMKKPLRFPLDADVPEVSNQYKNVASYRCEVIGNVFESPDLLEVMN